MVLSFFGSDEEEEGNPMVAEFQDEIDSDDEIVPEKSSAVSVGRPLVRQDLDLSSDEEDLQKHSVVTVDKDFSSSDDENDVHKTSVNVSNDVVKGVRMADLENGDIKKDEIKSKSNSFSSNSDKDSQITNNYSNATGFEAKDRADSASSATGSDLEKNIGSQNNNAHLSTVSGAGSRKISSDSSISESQRKSANQRAVYNESSANQDSDTENESEGGEISVMKDQDLDPADFGGADVFNDWLNKQEVHITFVVCKCFEFHKKICCFVKS